MRKSALFVTGVSIAAIGIALSGFPTGLSAHGKATGVVKERMELMKRHDELLDRIFAMIRGELSYSEKLVKAAAREIKETSARHYVKLFPKGSDRKPSEALPAIWTEFDRFSQMADRLRDFAEDLERSAAEKPASPSGLPKKWEDVPAMGGGFGFGRGGPMRGQGPDGGGGARFLGPGMMGPGGRGRGPMSGPAGGGVEWAAQRVAHMCNNCHNLYRKQK